MVKRWETETTTSEIQPFHCCRIVKSGLNYVLAYNSSGTLKIDWHSGWDDTLSNWTNGLSDAALANGYAEEIVLRKYGALLHCFYVVEIVAGHFYLAYAWSDDDGASWTEDVADALEDGGDLTTQEIIDRRAVDVFYIDGTPYGLTCSSRATDPVRVYDLTDFSLSDDAGWTTCSKGYVEDDVFYFAFENGGKTYFGQFIAGALSTVEQIDNKVWGDSAYINSLCSKVGNTIYFIYNFSVSARLIHKNQTESTWTFVATQYSDHISITWDEDLTNSTSIKFIHIYTVTDDLYYVTPAGYLVKIQKNVSSSSKHGIDKFIYPYEIESITYSPGNRVPIFGGKYQAQSCNLIHIGTDYAKGDGIVLTDDSDNVKFIGVIDPKKGIIPIGTSAQNITFVSPGKFDLEEKVSYEFLTKTIPEMRTIDFAETRYYYEGTIDANATTYDYSCNQIPRVQFWKELDELGLKRTNKSNELGEISMEDADIDSGISITHLNMGSRPVIQPQGAGFNRIWVIGGSKPDGTGLAKNFYNIPTAGDQQINSIIFVHPNRRTDALCLADAIIIGDNVSAALKSITCKFIGQGKPLEGTTVNITYAPESLAATDFIVESYTYELLTDVFDMNGLSALHWKGKDMDQLLEGTRAALNQLAIDVGNLIEGGTIWYLDDTNSDIGGYESLNLVYDAAAEVDYPVANAVDGELIAVFATAIGAPGITNLLTGQYGVHFHASKTGGVQNIAIYYEIYKRAHPGGGEVLLATSHPTNAFEGADNSLATHVHLEDTALLSTDRIVIKFKASVSGLGNAPSFDMHVQGTTTSRFQFPFILTGGAQPFVLKTDLENPPIEDNALSAPTSEWAFDHNAKNDADLLIGAANAQYVPCSYLANANPGKVRETGGLSNVDGTDDSWVYQLTGLPINRGSLTLHVQGILISIGDADGNDYISRTRVFFVKGGSKVEKYDDGYDMVVPGDYFDGDGNLAAWGAADDADTFRQIQVTLNTVATNAFDLEVFAVLLEVYYA